MTKSRVLVVEDEILVAENIRERLQTLGYEVPTIVSTGSKAVRVAVETRPDVVLMDIQLEGEIDGVEAAAQIRARADIPVIYLTAHVNPTILERVKLTAPYGYILKPYQIRELHSAIEIALSKHELETKLQESESRYRQLFEGINDAVMVYNQQGEFLDCNRITLQRLGYSREEFLRLKITDIVHPEFQPTMQINQENLWAEESRVVEAVHRRKDDQTIQVEINAQRIEYRGEPAILAVGRDISERKQTEEELRRYRHHLEELVEERTAKLTAVALDNARLRTEAERRAKELAVLNTAGRAMTSTLDLDAVLEQMMVEVKNILEAEDASVLLLDPANEELYFAAQADPATSVSLIGHRVPFAKSIAGRAIQAREPILIDDAQKELDFYSQIDGLTGMTTRSLLAVPLIYQNEAIGVVEVINKAEEAFNRHDLELLEALSRSATIAIENARLHTETKAHAQQLIVLRELDQAITASLHIDDVYYAFASHAARLLSYDRMSIALLEDEEVYVTYVDAQSPGRLAQGTTLPRQNSAVGWVARQGQPLVRHNIANDTRFSEDEHLVATGILSSISIPLRVKRRVIGTWNIGSRQIGAYGPKELAIAQSMADQLAVAIENARLYNKEREQFRRLQQSQAQLIHVEKMAALGRLVASIAHEINNPLQAIQNCFVLIEEELEEEQRPDKLNLYTAVAKNEVARISAIVRRMRDFYRPTHRKPDITAPNATTMNDFYHLSPAELQTVDLHAILENVLQLANKQLQHSGVQVERSWTDGLPEIRGGPDQLKQVFLNLVLNAIDAMADVGGGMLQILTRLDPASSCGDRIQPFVRIEFSDTGAGMPPEVLSRLFEPLFTTKEHGSGFGLFTSYKIVEAHHGRITVRSQVGKGTTFTILLPLNQPQTK